MYHILYQNDLESKNIFDLSDQELEKVIKAYNEGKDSFFLRGEIHSFNNLLMLKIFQSDIPYATIRLNNEDVDKQNGISTNFAIGTPYVNQRGLSIFGKDITMATLLKDFGEDSKSLNRQEDNDQAQEIEYDYAIITALYKDELRFIEPYINYIGELVEDDKKLIRYGTLKSNPSIKVVYASLLNTGMVDAAIVTTEILVKFKPKILLMPGVCGGRDQDNLDLLDIVVAKSVYTFSKGKLKEDDFEYESEAIDLNDKIIQKIQAAESELIASLHYEGKVHYEPIACSTFVVDQDGFLDAISKLKDRKTIALEMESYGVARACSIVNNGKTKAVIVKSVMDKTKSKNDEHKKLAAQYSADFAMSLIEREVLV